MLQLPSFSITTWRLLSKTAEIRGCVWANKENTTLLFVKPCTHTNSSSKDKMCDNWINNQLTQNKKSRGTGNTWHFHQRFENHYKNCSWFNLQITWRLAESGGMERALTHRNLTPKYSCHNPWVRDNTLQIHSSEKLCGHDKHVLHMWCCIIKCYHCYGWKTREGSKQNWIKLVYEVILYLGKAFLGIT